jgi:hypothetical protein
VAQVLDEPSRVIAVRSLLGARERSAAQRIREQRRLLGQKEALPAQELRPEHARALPQLESPWPLRPRPRAESARALPVRRLVAGAEEGRQRARRCEGEEAALAQELLRVVERLQRAVGRQPKEERAVLKNRHFDPRV